MNENNNTEKWVTLKETQAHLGIGRETILQWIAKRNTPAYKMGRSWKSKILEVDERVHSGEIVDKVNSDKSKEA